MNPTEGIQRRFIPILQYEKFHQVFSVQIVNEKRWEQRFNELVQYKKTYGNIQVSRKMRCETLNIRFLTPFLDGIYKQLFNWIDWQKRMFRLKRLLKCR